MTRRGDTVFMQELTDSEKVIPVVVVDSVDEGLGVGQALLTGGIHTAEVTFRTSAAADAIRAMSRLKDLVVGAGTVINADQARQAIEAGCRYIVSPGYSDEVISVCQDAGIPAVPACTDGSWIMRALERGIDIVKFFPAEALGGITTIKALAAPFPQVGFIPTGGVNPDNLRDLLALPCVRACGGSWMVKSSLVKAGDWDTIADLSRQAVRTVQEVTA